MKVFWLIFTAFILLFCFEETKGQTYKTDTVYFQSGDKVTGEMLSLDKGILKLKTDDAGTLSIKWINIDSLCVLNPLRILKHNGGVMYGQLYPSGKRQVCILLDENNNTNEIELQSIVELMQLRKRIVDRLTGTLSAGYGYIKATNVTQLDFNGNVDYKGEKSIISANYNIVLTDDKLQLTQRQTGGASYNRVLPKNWSVQGRLLAESNSEFKLDLRTSVISGVNYSFIRSNRQILQSGGGFSFNREFSDTLAQNNFEGIIGIKYSLFILNSPKVSFNFDGYVIPGINRFGRVRSSVNGDLNWELFNDFYLKWTLFYSSDNEPLSGADVKNDWGTSLGIEFKFQ
ncbi:MAG TPA: DUF481 domain-containing protein [Draconibacterium sp.]|nr:DUF481 domain-containing protein [Draconibacterium sp.]